MSALIKKFEDSTLYKKGIEFSKIEEIAPGLECEMDALADIAETASGRDFRVGAATYEDGRIDLVCWAHDTVKHPLFPWRESKAPAFGIRLSVGSVSPDLRIIDLEPPVARFETVPNSFRQAPIYSYKFKGEGIQGRLQAAFDKVQVVGGILRMPIPSRTEKPIDQIETALTDFKVWLGNRMPEKNLSTFLRLIKEHENKQAQKITARLVQAP